MLVIFRVSDMTGKLVMCSESWSYAPKVGDKITPTRVPLISAIKIRVNQLNRSIGIHPYWMNFNNASSRKSSRD